MNNDGTTKSNPIVPNSMPPTVLTPTEIFPLAPTPVCKHQWQHAKIIVIEVIRIGRKRALAAHMAAAGILIP